MGSTAQGPGRPFGPAMSDRYAGQLVPQGISAELVADKWKRMKILPSEICTDDEFLRRIYLDLTGLPPSSDVVREFVSDSRPLRYKRNEVIDKLVLSEEYVDHWTNKWADLLLVNGKKQEAVAKATAGDIVAIPKLKATTVFASPSKAR